MKTYLNLLSAIIMLSMLSTSTVYGQREKQPAFPGAEGFGRYTTGGRGGSVYHVTTLEDNGDDKQPIEGSLRWAVQHREPRTVVFDLSGTIHLSAPLKVKYDNITIAGQTAPGDGVCIADCPFSLACDNAIIRYLRFRLGTKNVQEKGADGWDGFGASDHSDIIVDHCSISWSIDECCSLVGNRNITVQWCMIDQSLRNSGHSKGSHGYGGNWGGDGASYHHNLLAHHESRCPRLGPRYTTQLSERLDMRNNVMYNWGGQGCYGGEAMTINIVNNYYKPGPATLMRSKQVQKRIAMVGIRTEEYINRYPRFAPSLHMWAKLYVDGNINARFPAVKADNWQEGIYSQIDPSKNDNLWNETVRDTMRLRQAMPIYPTTTHTADDAYLKVLQYAGASLHRDSHDRDIVNQVIDGLAPYGGSLDKKGNPMPGIIDTPMDNNPDADNRSYDPFPVLQSFAAPEDKDGDGMADEWEISVGLNPENPDDGKLIHRQSGYTFLEVYLNAIVAEITAKQLGEGVMTGTPVMR